MNCAKFSFQKYSRRSHWPPPEPESLAAARRHSPRTESLAQPVKLAAAKFSGLTGIFPRIRRIFPSGNIRSHRLPVTGSHGGKVSGRPSDPANPACRCPVKTFLSLAVGWPLPSQSDPLVSEANLNILFMFARSQARAQNTGSGPTGASTRWLRQPNCYRALWGFQRKKL